MAAFRSDGGAIVTAAWVRTARICFFKSRTSLGKAEVAGAILTGSTGLFARAAACCPLVGVLDGERVVLATVPLGADARRRARQVRHHDHAIDLAALEGVQKLRIVLERHATE